MKKAGGKSNNFAAEESEDEMSSDKSLDEASDVEDSVTGEEVADTSNSNLLEAWQKVQSSYQGENMYVSDILEWHPDTRPSAVEEFKSDAEDEEEEFDITELETIDVWKEEHESMKKEKEKEGRKKKKKSAKEEDSDEEENFKKMKIKKEKGDKDRIEIGEVKREGDSLSSAEANKWYKDRKATIQKQAPPKSASTPVELEKLKEQYMIKLKDLKKRYKNGTINPAQMKMMNKLNKKMSLMDLRMKKINKKSLKEGNYLQRQAELADYKAKKNAKLRAGDDDDENRVAVYSKKGNLLFSRFDFSKEVAELMEEERPRHIKDLLKEKLEKLEEIKELEESGDLTTAAKMKQAEMWASVFNKAEKGKEKHSVDRLKKMIKERERKKRNSRKKWAERIEAVKKQQEERQETRRRHIKERKDAKLQKKMKRMVKKGHHIPGVTC